MKANDHAAPTPLLKIRGLRVHFASEAGTVRSVDGVDMDVARAESVCIVGESGSGKTVTAQSILRLVPMPPGKFVGGEIVWRGRDLIPMPEHELRRVRTKEIGIVFQEPMTSLNPVYSVGEQIAEAVRIHEGVSRKAALDRAAEMLDLVRIPHARKRVGDYPHHFSGGMRQRVMIAMALSCDPQMLIADEPTTALDVTIQSQILELLREITSRSGMSLLLITHAMGVVAEIAERVMVMYAGKVVEEAPVQALFAQPHHPYTQGLIRCIPRIDGPAGTKSALPTIAGSVPNLAIEQPGCRFASRCSRVVAQCRVDAPAFREVAPGHRVACFLP